MTGFAVQEAIIKTCEPNHHVCLSSLVTIFVRPAFFRQTSNTITRQLQANCLWRHMASNLSREATAKSQSSRTSKISSRVINSGTTLLSRRPTGGSSMLRCMLLWNHHPRSLHRRMLWSMSRLCWMFRRWSNNKP